MEPEQARQPKKKQIRRDLQANFKCQSQGCGKKYVNKQSLSRHNRVDHAKKLPSYASNKEVEIGSLKKEKVEAEPIAKQKAATEAKDEVEAANVRRQKAEAHALSVKLREAAEEKTAKEKIAAAEKPAEGTAYYDVFADKENYVYFCEHCEHKTDSDDSLAAHRIEVHATHKVEVHATPRKINVGNEEGAKDSEDKKEERKKIFLASTVRLFGGKRGSDELPASSPKRAKVETAEEKQDEDEGDSDFMLSDEEEDEEGDVTGEVRALGRVYLKGTSDENSIERADKGVEEIEHVERDEGLTDFVSSSKAATTPSKKDVDEDETKGDVKMGVAQTTDSAVALLADLVQGGAISVFIPRAPRASVIVPRASVIQKTPTPNRPTQKETVIAFNFDDDDVVILEH